MLPVNQPPAAPLPRRDPQRAAELLLEPELKLSGGLEPGQVPGGVDDTCRALAQSRAATGRLTYDINLGKHFHKLSPEAQLGCVGRACLYTS